MAEDAQEGFGLAAVGADEQGVCAPTEFKVPGEAGGEGIGVRGEGGPDVGGDDEARVGVEEVGAFAEEGAVEVDGVGRGWGHGWAGGPEWGPGGVAAVSVEAIGRID